MSTIGGLARAEKAPLPAVAVSLRRRPPLPVQPGRILLYIVLVGYGLFSLAPFLFAFSSSFKTYAQVLSWPPSLLPNPATLDNYRFILSGSQLFPRYILNSIIYAGAVTILNVLLASMAGYAFGRMEFPGKNFFYLLTLAVLMIPAQLILIPKFLVAYTLGLTDNYGGLIVPAMVTPTSVFLMTQFLKTLPRELEEAALIDGCSRFRAFWQIIFPLVRPAVTVVALLSFQGAWNEFLWPLIVMSHQENYTLTVGLAFFKGNYVTQYNLVLAGAMISIAPLVIIFFIFQRYFIQGLATSGLAGR
uniref:ABC transporter permease n=1 Tax=Thermogemmatispora argillosa TaxID=2045280 RepID=A0A455T159_9CHLR|nr:ABC transporter permease [Thermogemmatispora argillosa]